MTVEILVFDLAERRFGLRTSFVREVVRAVTLTMPPGAPGLIEGLLDLRGQIVPVVDLRRVFDLPLRAISHRDHLIVAQQNSRLLALRVDRAVELVTIPATEVADSQEQHDDRGFFEFTARVERDTAAIVHVVNFPALLAIESVAAFDQRLRDGASLEVPV